MMVRCYWWGSGGNGNGLAIIILLMMVLAVGLFFNVDDGVLTKGLVK
jgi:hypothetical protein